MKTFGNDEKAAFAFAAQTGATVYARHHSAFGTEYAVGDYPEPLLDDTSEEWTVVEAPLSDDLPTDTELAEAIQKHTFTQYVHEFIAPNGETRYAVGEWDEQRGQYTRPFDATERKLTGCHTEFARRPDGMQTFRNRTRALRRARYLYGQESDHD